MTYLTKKQQTDRFIEEFLGRLREAPPEGAKRNINEKRKIEIKAPSETLSPLG